MKNWEKYQKRIAIANNATIFVLMIADLGRELSMRCSIKKYFGKCKSPSNEDCVACKMKWLNAEEEEKGELFKWTTL